MDFSSVNLNFSGLGRLTEGDRFLLAHTTALREGDYSGCGTSTGRFCFKGKWLSFSVRIQDPITGLPALWIESNKFSLGDTVDWNGPIGYFLFFGKARLEVQEEFADNGRL